MKQYITKQTEGCWGERGRERVVELWTLGSVCAMVSAVKCVSLAIHRPVPLGLIIHYRFIRKLKNLKKIQREQVFQEPIVCSV